MEWVAWLGGDGRRSVHAQAALPELHTAPVLGLVQLEPVDEASGSTEMRKLPHVFASFQTVVVVSTGPKTVTLASTSTSTEARG